MSLKSIETKIAGLKEVSADDRIDIMDEIEVYEDRIQAAREALGALPDTEPEQGEQDPRDAFVDELMAGEREINVKSNNGVGSGAS